MISIIKSKKPIIGMIHLDYLEGQSDFKGYDFVIKKALEDLSALENGGVDAVLIENWKDETEGAFVDTDIIVSMTNIIQEIVKKTKLPVGVNVLPNDYRAAFQIAKSCNLKFIQLDVFVDKVKTNYSYSKAKPFEVILDLKYFNLCKEKCDEDIIILTTIHPKHYSMLENKTLIESAKEAIENGTDIVVVTGEVTGKAPVVDEIKVLREALNDFPIFIGSGLNKNNAQELLEYSDGAIVGTAFKDENFDKVVESNVKEIMELLKEINQLPNNK